MSPRRLHQRRLCECVLYPAFRHVKIVLSQFVADKRAPFRDGGDARRATAHAEIEYHVAGVGVRANQVGIERNRFLGGMVL